MKEMEPYDGARTQEVSLAILQAAATLAAGVIQAEATSEVASAVSDLDSTVGLLQEAIDGDNTGDAVEFVCPPVVEALEDAAERVSDIVRAMEEKRVGN